MFKNYLSVCFQSHPRAIGLRNKPFLFLEEIFIEDQATGEGPDAPIDDVEKIKHEEAITVTELIIS